MLLLHLMVERSKSSHKRSPRRSDRERQWNRHKETQIPWGLARIPKL